MKTLILLFVAALISSCSSTVLVKKDSCKEFFGEALLECEKVSK